jgi:hypothetical protein
MRDCRQIRECHQQGDQRRISQIIDQLVEMFNNISNPLHIRNGGLIGLAGTAIALGVDVAPYMEKFVRPLLDCFVDPENRIRYFSAECLYNIAKVSKGEVLVYFNDIFDALSKVGEFMLINTFRFCLTQNASSQLIQSCLLKMALNSLIVFSKILLPSLLRFTFPFTRKLRKFEMNVMMFRVSWCHIQTAYLEKSAIEPEKRSLLPISFPFLVNGYMSSAHLREAT